MDPNSPYEIEISLMNKWAKIPTKAHPTDAGFDLFTDRNITVKGHGLFNLTTGVRVALPHGFWGQLISRSSTMRRFGLQVVEAVIDNGYRGELFIQVINPGYAPVEIEQHSRIAQLILHEQKIFYFNPKKRLSPTPRGAKGFGSSGR